MSLRVCWAKQSHPGKADILQGSGSNQHPDQTAAGETAGIAADDIQDSLLPGRALVCGKIGHHRGYFTDMGNARQTTVLGAKKGKTAVYRAALPHDLSRRQRHCRSAPLKRQIIASSAGDTPIPRRQPPHGALELVSRQQLIAGDTKFAIQLAVDRRVFVLFRAFFDLERDGFDGLTELHRLIGVILRPGSPRVDSNSSRRCS
jgi:hypothetical protein